MTMRNKPKHQEFWIVNLGRGKPEVVEVFITDWSKCVLTCGQEESVPLEEVRFIRRVVMPLDSRLLMVYNYEGKRFEEPTR